jgi:hypothetical protein
MARLLTVALALVAIPATVLANADTRTIQAAANDLGPAIPEPSSIFLFLAGVAVVGWGVQRRRSRRSS